MPSLIEGKSGLASMNGTTEEAQSMLEAADRDPAQRSNHEEERRFTVPKCDSQKRLCILSATISDETKVPSNESSTGL